jgi:AAA15 family ATPase/GTPase
MVLLFPCGTDILYDNIIRGWYMSEPLVRFLSIEIHNLKNVCSGTITFTRSQENDGFSEKADIAGIYGQNGSGKTTVVQAVGLFKQIAAGAPFWSDIAECITVNSSDCSLTFKFAVQTEAGKKIIVTYTCSILKEASPEIGSCFASEQLSVSKENNGEWSKTVPYFEYEYPNTAVQVFSPKNRYENITGGDQQKIVNLSVAYKLAQKNHTSFLFSKDFFEQLKTSPETELAELVMIFREYAARKLFTITNAHSAFISINLAIPLAVSHSSPAYTVIGDVPLAQNEQSVTDERTYHIITSILSDMDCVMNALVPGLSIKTREYGKELLKNGKEGIRYEVVSDRNGSIIPIRYESEGIRKILSVLNLLIAMYNNPSVCVAVDELDAGIFELLLGELLYVIEESGKGQFIFTSHNLRPLEILDKENVIFTTTNPDNRYIRLKNVRPTNNLRDCYIRALNLGGQQEELATQAKTAAIRRALRKAGENGRT